MVFDKAIVLIEHQDNELFSVYYRTNGAINWHWFVCDCSFDEAKQWVKLVKIAHEIVENKGSNYISLAVMKLVTFIANNQLNEKKLTAQKLFNLYTKQKR